MRAFVIALTAVSMAGAAGEPTDSKQELARLAGRWRVLTQESDGKAQPAEKRPKELGVALPINRALKRYGEAFPYPLARAQVRSTGRWVGVRPLGIYV